MPHVDGKYTGLQELAGSSFRRLDWAAGLKLVPDDDDNGKSVVYR